MILRTLNYGNYGLFLIMGNAGFPSSTVELRGFGPVLGPGGFLPVPPQQAFFTYDMQR